MERNYSWVVLRYVGALRLASAILVLLVASFATWGGDSTPTVQLVACAPGYPGTAEQAQPLMDAFATAVSQKLGISIEARYEPELEAGLALLSESPIGLAVVPVSFYLEFRDRASLVPLLSVEYESGATDRWALAAAVSRIPGPDGLANWTIRGTPGYSPAFVRNVALAEWGELPSSVQIEPTRRVLSELRKAAKGEPVAVLLDRAQAEALPSLPFASAIEIVASSAELPAFVLCSIGDRIEPARRAALHDAFLELHTDVSVRAAMNGIRIRRFLPLAEDSLRQVERRFIGNF